MTKISFVIPCYNNEPNIDGLFDALTANEKNFSDVSFEYVMVDDCSTDKTVEVLRRQEKQIPEKIKILQLYNNIGSHKAIFKGLQAVSGDCIIVMAADLQDPPELSKQLFEKWEKGNKLVLAIKTNPLPFTSRLFHFIMKSFVNNAPSRSFDYILFDKSIIKALLKPSKRNCNFFYRLVDINPDYSEINYLKRTRLNGKSGWTFRKKLLFFIENLLGYAIR